jgi:hypothetical protein
MDARRTNPTGFEAIVALDQAYKSMVQIAETKNAKNCAYSSARHEPVVMHNILKRLLSCSNQQKEFKPVAAATEFADRVKLIQNDSSYFDAGMKTLIEKAAASFKIILANTAKSAKVKDPGLTLPNAPSAPVATAETSVEKTKTASTRLSELVKASSVIQSLASSKLPNACVTKDLSLQPANGSKALHQALDPKKSFETMKAYVQRVALSHLTDKDVGMKTLQKAITVYNNAIALSTAAKQSYAYTHGLFHTARSDANSVNNFYITKETLCEGVENPAKKTQLESLFPTETRPEARPAVLAPTTTPTAPKVESIKK